MKLALAKRILASGRSALPSASIAIRPHSPHAPPMKRVATRLIAFFIATAPMTHAAERSLSRTNLLEFRDAQGVVRTVRTERDWQQRRRDIIAGMIQIMGPVPGPEKRCPLDVQLQEETDCGE